MAIDICELRPLCAIVVQTHQRIAVVVENMSWLACPHCGAEVAVFGSGGGQS